MKKIILIIATILLTTSIVYSQWMNQVSGSTNTLYDIEFLNSNTGWVVGVGGTIRKTTNGGINWITIPSPIPGRLFSSIHLVDSNYAYIVGDFEAIIKTSDGGNSWTILRQATTGEGNSHSGVFFINKDSGWICGNSLYVLRTKDGGQHFDSSYVFWGILEDMFFKDYNTGVMCGWAGGTFKTTNGGDSWFRTKVHLPTNQPPFRKLSFTNGDTGWIVGGDGRVFRTTNFGTSWDSISHLLTSPVAMYGIEFVDNNTGWICGEEGVIYKTTNSGKNWIQQVSNTNRLITSLWFYNDSIGWASGGQGRILFTENGGLTSINEQEMFPREFRLYQNYPNPFNPSTIINYELGIKNYVSIKVYDILGNIIANLVENREDSGLHSVEWNTENFPSGIYFYKIIIGQFSETKKMILQK